MNANPNSAQTMIDLIQDQLAADGVDWQKSQADGLKLGDAGVAVTGVAVTFQPTLEVLRAARDRGLNLVITHEATFWEGFDAPQIMRGEPLRLLKERFVEDNSMVIWRLHDHLHRMSPEPVFTALLRALGWAPRAGSGGLPLVEVAETTLDDVARHLQTSLDTRNVTVVGDPALSVRIIGFGAHVLSTVLPAFRSADVAIVGETSEFDTFEYARDATALGMPKGLIRISHERLEEWGMEHFANWLRPRVPVPVEWISTGDPFSVV